MLQISLRMRCHFFPLSTTGPAWGSFALAAPAWDGPPWLVLPNWILIPIKFNPDVHLSDMNRKTGTHGLTRANQLHMQFYSVVFEFHDQGSYAFLTP